MANTIGWGQAAVNNTIDWGKGKTNNAIGWGSVYSASPSGETDIVGTLPVDADAQLFITNAAITDTTQKAAIDKLVVDLKGYGIWTKMKAIYPFCGGTAAQHKYNLRNPLDTDAAFRLVFNGGWTHSSTGALPNGTNAYANTFLNPLTKTTANSLSFNYYSKTNIDANGFHVFAGAIEAPNYLQFFQYQNSTYYDTYDPQVYNGRIIVPNTKTYGNFLGNRVLNTKQIYINSAKITPIDPNYSQGQGGARPNLNLYLAAMNTVGNAAIYFSSLQCSFSSIGDGLTDTEAANYYTAIQAFQTTLGRSVI